jgi:SNF2 family DNA or RNA helicase
VADPSLVIDVANYWTAPAEVIARLGEQAEVTLLAGLRTLGRLVPPLETVLDQVAPTEATLADPELDLLLDALDDLFEHGIDVRWPAELVAPRLERRLVASADTSAPSGSLTTVLDLERLLTVDWELLLDGVALTPAELEVLGEAKRAIVPLRGRWVRLDPADRARLKARAPEVSVGQVLAAALSDNPTITIDPDTNPVPDTDPSGDPDRDEAGFGATVRLRLEGAVADLVARLAALTGHREEPEPLGLEAQLRPYQRRGLAWMADLCTLGVGGCLADDMGLGKTIQVLALHAHRQLHHHAPTLIVCPTSLIGNWEREAARFLPDTEVRIYHGPNRTLEGVKPAELVITTYGVVRGDADQLATVDWGLAVADEAQQAKNPRSATARALRQVPARTRLALTGTPIENRLSELWSIFDWAVPGLLGPLATFNRTTAVPIERDGSRAVAQRLGALLAPFLLRRRKTDPGIAPELPPKIERDVVVPLSPEQATLYRATVDQTLAQIAETDGIQRRGLVLALLTKLKQITNHPAQFLDEPEPAPLEARSGKLDALDELLGVVAANGESTLIFTQYVQMGRLLVDHLANTGTTSGIDAALLHGGLSRSARQRLVDDFQARELNVLVLSLKAGGTGLNLTAATNVVHFDRWWNPAVEDQATDRAYRIGQAETVTVHRLVTQGTVEDRVAELLTEKRQLADRVVGPAAGGSGGESWIAELSDDELADLVTLEPPGGDTDG